MIPPWGSTKTGTMKPKAAMLPASSAICWSEWVRAFRAEGINRGKGHSSIWEARGSVAELRWGIRADVLG
jgi:hypothetical protein